MSELKLKCPDCGETMEVNEEAHVCASCETTVGLDEAVKGFEDGEYIAVLDEAKEDEESESEDEESEDEDEESEDEDEVKEEGFCGFENQNTWETALVLQNEYKLFKNVVKESEDAKVSADAIKSIVESNKDMFGEDFDNVNFEQIAEDFESSLEDSAAYKSDIVEALAKVEELDEDVKSEIETIFEAALYVKINDMKLRFEEKTEAEIDSAKVEIRESVEDEVDGYLDVVVSEWMNENKLAVEHGIRNELTESFIDGLKGLFAEHYIDVPAERYDILEDLASKVEELEGKLDESKEASAELENTISEMKKDAVLAKVVSEMVDTDKEKLIELSESVDYENEEQYEKALNTLKVSFTNENTSEDGTESEVIAEESENTENTELDHGMARVLSILNR